MDNSVQISNISISQTETGLFSLNDLHRASGGEDRHSPRRWLQNTQAIDLIKELEIDGKPSISKKQRLGTFVCKELVIAYGMWISPKFALQVIQTFLAVSAVSETPRTNPDLTDLSTRLSSLEAQMAALETQMAALHPHSEAPTQDESPTQDEAPTQANLSHFSYGTPFKVKANGCDVHAVQDKVEGLILCMKDVCRASKMKWDVQRAGLKGERLYCRFGFGGLSAIGITLSDALDWLRTKSPARVSHPADLMQTIADLSTLSDTFPKGVEND